MRVQINTTNEVVAEIDRRAAEIGISRNAMCAVLLHDAVFGADNGSASGSCQNKSETEVVESG